jgi:lysophospholipase L1-like esterase
MLKKITVALMLGISLLVSAGDTALPSNGDFSVLDGKGMPVGWNLSGSAQHEIAIEKDADSANVLRLTVKTIGKGDGFIRAPQVAGLKKNTRYRLSCEIKGSRGLAYAQVKLYRDKKELKRYSTAKCQGYWGKVVVSFDSDDSDRVAIFLRHKQIEASLNQTVYFRNVKLSEAASASAQPTIWLIGDSTVCNYKKNRFPQTGWGQVLPAFCKSDIAVSNHAVGGRSTKSFRDEKRWDKALSKLQKNDYVMIQFGHNDQKKQKPKIYAPADSLYQELLKAYIAETRAKGAHPVLVTSVCRRVYKNGKIYNSLGQYPQAMKTVAQETGTPVIDLNAISLTKFNEIGPEASKNIFLHLPAGKYEQWPEGRQDNSHFQEAGAKLIAGWIVADAKKQALPIAKLFK